MDFNIYVISDIVQAEEIAADIRKNYFGIIGFDTETTVTKARREGVIDLIQIYLEWNIVGRPKLKICYLFHVAAWETDDIRRDFPQSLAKIIRSKQILKAVAAPENDSRWLYDDFGLTMMGYIDIQTFAVQMGETKISLDSLASKYLPNWKSKNKNMYKAPWNNKLTNEMIEYASYDAYASYHIFVTMFPNLFPSGRTSQIQVEKFDVVVVQ